MSHSHHTAGLPVMTVANRLVLCTTAMCVLALLVAVVGALQQSPEAAVGALRVMLPWVLALQVFVWLGSLAYMTFLDHLLSETTHITHPADAAAHAAA